MNFRIISLTFNLLLFGFLIINSNGENIEQTSRSTSIQNQNETISTINSTNATFVTEQVVINSTELVTKTLIDTNNSTTEGSNQTNNVTKIITETQVETSTFQSTSTTVKPTNTPRTTTTSKPTTSEEPKPAILTTTHEAHKKNKSGITASGFFLGFFVAFLLMFIAFMGLRFYQKRNSIPYGIL